MPPRVLLIVNPFASGVTEERVESVVLVFDVDRGGGGPEVLEHDRVVRGGRPSAGEHVQIVAVPLGLGPVDAELDGLQLDLEADVVQKLRARLRHLLVH